MQLVNTYVAKAQLSKLIEKALQGEEVIIGKAGKPMVKLVPYQAELTPRKPGLWKNKVKIAKDFDAPLPDDLLKYFTGEE